MIRPSWDETWMRVAQVVAQRSLCSRAQCGAVIVDPANRIVATGFNGPPAGMSTKLGAHGGDCRDFCPRGANGPTAESIISYSDCISIHAELNSLGFCDRTAREGGTIYITGAPCWTCGKAVANSGLIRVVIAHEGQDRSYRAPETTVDLLMASGLQVSLL